MREGVLELHDGRRLAFAEYGKSDGLPLLLFHGTPGCRLLPRLDTASWIIENGIRVIVPDRPGYGSSDPAPKRTIIDWATDVEELANHLGLGRYHVAGGSGGGPYALACAIHSPERVMSATLICSGCPPEVMPSSKEMNRGNRVVFFLARYAPLILRGGVRGQCQSHEETAGRTGTRLKEGAKIGPPEGEAACPSTRVG